MRNTWLVIRHEIRTIIRKPSFWLTTFLFPLLIVLFMSGSQLLARNVISEVNAELPGGAGAGALASGYVDQAGLIAQLPEDFPAELFLAFPDEATARAALDAGAIQRYFIVPADYVQTGNLIQVDSRFDPFSAFIGNSVFEQILTANLIGDPALAELMSDPTPRVTNHQLAPRAAVDTEDLGASAVPVIVLFVFFFILTTSSSFLLQSVAAEKENRVVEILLLSLRPRELMLGKIVGLGALALFQMTIWLGGSSLLLGGGLPALAGANFSLPPNFAVWAVLYFLLGYALYASVLGAIGALAANLREGTQFTFIIMLPLMVSLWFNSAFTETPDSGLVTFLSLFPLTAPTAMITRLTVTTVPLEQLLLGLAGLAATAYLIVLLAARLFRADTLLSTASLNWRRIAGELRR